MCVGLMACCSPARHVRLTVYGEPRSAPKFGRQVQSSYHVAPKRPLPSCLQRHCIPKSAVTERMASRLEHMGSAARLMAADALLARTGTCSLQCQLLGRNDQSSLGSQGTVFDIHVHDALPRLRRSRLAESISKHGFATYRKDHISIPREHSKQQRCTLVASGSVYGTVEV